MRDRDSDPPPGRTEIGHTQVVVVVKQDDTLGRVQEEAREQAAKGSRLAGRTRVDVGFPQVEGGGET